MAPANSQSSSSDPQWMQSMQGMWSGPSGTNHGVPAPLPTTSDGRVDSTGEEPVPPPSLADYNHTTVEAAAAVAAAAASNAAAKEASSELNRNKRKSNEINSNSIPQATITEITSGNGTSARNHNSGRASADVESSETSAANKKARNIDPSPRAEQNRRAQKAFRQRRDAKFREMSMKMAEIERLTNETVGLHAQVESQHKQIAELQAENAKWKAAAEAEATDVIRELQSTNDKLKKAIAALMGGGGAGPAANGINASAAALVGASTAEERNEALVKAIAALTGGSELIFDNMDTASSSQGVAAGETTEGDQKTGAGLGQLSAAAAAAPRAEAPRRVGRRGPAGATET